MIATFVPVGTEAGAPPGLMSRLRQAGEAAGPPETIIARSMEERSSQVRANHIIIARTIGGSAASPTAGTNAT